MTMLRLAAAPRPSGRRDALALWRSLAIVAALLLGAMLLLPGNARPPSVHAIAASPAPSAGGPHGLPVRGPGADLSAESI